MSVPKESPAQKAELGREQMYWPVVALLVCGVSEGEGEGEGEGKGEGEGVWLTM